MATRQGTPDVKGNGQTSGQISIIQSQSFYLISTHLYASSSQGLGFPRPHRLISRYSWKSRSSNCRNHHYTALFLLFALPGAAPKHLAEEDHTSRTWKRSGTMFISEATDSSLGTYLISLWNCFIHHFLVLSPLEVSWDWYRPGQLRSLGSHTQLEDQACSLSYQTKELSCEWAIRAGR